jgi:hypothetical protein
VGEVAISEEEQWRSSTAFEPKKNGTQGGSSQARGQERRGGGGGWGERHMGRGSRRLLHAAPGASSRAGPVSVMWERS